MVNIEAFQAKLKEIDSSFTCKEEKGYSLPDQYSIVIFKQRKNPMIRLFGFINFCGGCCLQADNYYPQITVDNKDNIKEHIEFLSQIFSVLQRDHSMLMYITNENQDYLVKDIFIPMGFTEQYSIKNKNSGRNCKLWCINLDEMIKTNFNIVKEDTKVELV